MLFSRSVGVQAASPASANAKTYNAARARLAPTYRFAGWRMQRRSMPTRTTTSDSSPLKPCTVPTRTSPGNGAAKASVVAQASSPAAQADAALSRR